MAVSKKFSSDSNLHPELVEKVLSKLRLAHHPELTLEGLRTVYAAWCQQVPFDNVRKMIHLRSGNSGPLPGSNAEDFFTAWLRFGTGGTCWSGAGALHALLTSLGFNAARGIATMLAAPNIPPNHGTVLVTFGPEQYLVDNGILHGEPLLMKADAETSIQHPAWGVRGGWKEGRWHVAWRPLHKVDGFECRFESFGASADDYVARYDKTRSWSPFNYETYARVNKGDHVIGIAFGQAVSLQADGRVVRAPLLPKERTRLLIEEIGLSEEIVRQLPDDVPTPPPPGSQTARAEQG